ncbi:MAG: GAF domain-containing sensor histidine kinase [Candidatus Atribacteria bacterium]|nr:GAF domain-containing sensor histidine kinase [Candidatus Atribacteria bacterium]
MNSVENLFSKNEIKTLENIIDIAIKVSNAQTGSLLLARDDGSLFIAAGRGLLDKYIGSRVELDKKTVSGYVFQTGEPFIIDDNNISRFSRRKERKSYSISLPIKKTTNQVVGILNLNRSDKCFDNKSIPQLEAFATNIAILLEENNLRKDRERIIIALSEIIKLFSSLCCNDSLNEVFEKIYYAVKILTGVKRSSVFRLSKKRPYIVFSKEWPKKMNWRKFERINQQIQDLIDQKKVTFINFDLKTQLLFIPLISENHPPFLYVGIFGKNIDIIDYLVLSIVENMGNSTLENITLFKKSKKLTQEKERNRLARELHDGLAQILASTQIYLHFLENTVLEENQEQIEILKKIKSLNSLGIEESRFILSELKGKPITTFQFKEKINETTSLFVTPGNMIDIDYRVEVEKIPYRVYKMILKILQETLSNIQKHAQADKVTIQVMNSKRQMILFVEDNGIGFNPKIIDEKGTEHFGLQNLRERVRILRGKFKIDSKAGSGTKIMVKIPYEENEFNSPLEG